MAWQKSFMPPSNAAGATYRNNVDVETLKRAQEWLAKQDEATIIGFSACGLTGGLAIFYLMRGEKPQGE
jgi:DNA-binding MurR/RpiR family transcriptional regulator